MAQETQIAEVIRDIVAVANSVSGVDFAPTHPPDQAAQSPFAITYLSSGEHEIAASHVVRGLLEVTMHVALPLQNMSHADSIILPIGQRVIKALYQGLTDNDINPQNFTTMRSVYGPFVWGGIQMFGWTIVIENILVKENLA